MPNRPKIHRPAHARRTPIMSTGRRQRHAFYCSKEWLALRAVVLASQPLCEDCTAVGRATPATEVHHRTRVAIDSTLALDFDNVVGLCCSCHSKRTGRGE